MGQAKLERALKRGGVAERGSEGDYRVWRCRNRQRRSLGILKEKAGDDLRAHGKIELIQDETVLYVWAGPLETEGPAPPLPPPAVLAPRTARKAPRALLLRALEGAGDERERMRLADAASRFLGDAERAVQAGRVTMNWGELALGRSEAAPQSRANLPGYAGARAKARMTQLHTALSDETMQLLDWALAREVSGAELGRRLGVSPASAATQLTNALRDLARAYDHAVGR